MNSSTGHVRWYTRLGSTILGSPACSARQVFAVSSSGSNLAFIRSLKPANGRALWTYKANSVVASSPSVRGGQLLAGLDDGTLLALSTTSEKSIWTHVLRPPLKSSPIPETEH